MRRLRIAVAVAALLLAVGCAHLPGAGSSTTPTPTPAPSATPDNAPAWLLSAGGLQRLQQAGLPESLLQADFDVPGTVLLVQQGRPDSLAPRAQLAFDFSSAASLVQRLHAGTVPVSVHWLVLDLERWPLTPAGEQQDPVSALRQAVAAAHTAGKEVIFTPAVDLLSVLDPGEAPPAPARYTGAPAAAFERLVVRPAAPVTDVLEVQSQETEGIPEVTTFAPQVVDAVHSVRPQEEVLAGLSTNPNGRRVTANDLVTLYRAARSAGAGGFWLNIPEAGSACPNCGVPQPQIAVQFLETIAQGGAGSGS